MDTLAKAMTFGVIILFIVIGLSGVKAMLHAAGDRVIILIYSGTLLLFTAILLVSWLYAPQSYTVDKDVVSINRPIGKVIIQRTDIQEARLVAEGELKGSVRTFGNGGLFGYYGKFYNAHFGHMTLYATQRKNSILILTRQGQKIIISPDDRSIVEKIHP